MEQHDSRAEWRSLQREEILEPDLPIIDPHHHLWERPGNRYLIDDYLADVKTGHNIRASVFVECGAFYRKTGPALMAPVGEIEFANSIAATAAGGTGHNAFGGTMKDVKANVCPDPVNVPDNVRNYQPQINPTMNKLADGVYSFEAGTYKSIAVEFPQWIAVFEAPRSEDFSLRVIEAVAKQIPNKPIRYLVNSHQHSDAIAGLRAYSHIGATFVSNWHNSEYYRPGSSNYVPRAMEPAVVSV